MKCIMRLVMIVTLGYLLNGCTSTLPVTYSPSNLSTGSGSVSVEQFSYMAARKGEVEPNQPEKNPTGLGIIYLAENIEALFTDAVRKELRFSGHSLAEGAPTSVSGTIERFYYDWVGFLTESVDMTVTFHIKQNGKVTFTQTVTSHKEAPKDSGYAAEAMKSAISDCIHRFIQEAHIKRVL